jgi:hypothetical protein
MLRFISCMHGPKSRSNASTSKTATKTVHQTKTQTNSMPQTTPNKHRAELSRLAADGFRDSLDRAKSNLRSEKVDLSMQFFKHGSIRICRQKVRRDEYLHDLSGRTAKVINFY